MSMVLRVHRYQCSNLACGWEGVVSIPRPPSPPRNWLSWPSLSTGSWRVPVIWMLAGAVVAVAPIEGGRYMAHRQKERAAAVELASRQSQQPRLLAPLPGESLEGLLLAIQETPVPGKPKPLERREACLWGAPGRDPYKGTVRQALVGAKLPAEVVGKIDSMVVGGRKTGRLEISNRGIWTEDGRRRFDSNIVAMGFGNTLCFGTKVNFHPGHFETADLYETTDATGAKYSVMVPYVCGNVAVLAERAERVEPVRSVPEPETWVGVLAGLAAMAWAGHGYRRPQRRSTAGPAAAIQK